MDTTEGSILITGANGFVGSRLCRRFASAGFRVIAGVRKTSDLSLLEGVEVEYRYGDVTQAESLPDMVRGVNYIIHNAGVVKVKRKEMFFEVNEKGTLNLFEAIASHNPTVKRAVYISSQAAAGPSIDGEPVSEDDPPHPITTYGRSKLAGERAALRFADSFPVVSIRPPAIYGPGDTEMFSFFQIAYRRIRPIFGDPDRTFQPVYVDDLCEGVLKAVTTETFSGSIYFIADQYSYTMRRAMQILQEACGRKGFPLFIPVPVFRSIAALSEFAFKVAGKPPMLTREKVGELLASWHVSTDKAKRDLGFESTVAFPEGARRTFDWYIEKGWL